MARILVSDYSAVPIPEGTGATVRIEYADPSKQPSELHLSDEEADRLASGRLRLVDPLSLAKVRQKYPRAYEHWTQEEDDELARSYRGGMSALQLAEQLGRQPGAIGSRLRKLGLATPQGM